LELASTDFLAWVEKFREHPEEALEFLNHHNTIAERGMVGSGKGYHFVGIELKDVLAGMGESFYEYGWRSGYDTLSGLVNADGSIDLEFSSVKAGRWADAHAGELITQLEETTRLGVREIISKGVKEEQPWQVIKDNLIKAQEFGDRRAETIARTESAVAYNTGAVDCWSESGIVKRVRVTDGDYCDICRHVNGQTWTLEEAHKRPIEHPNCWREFYPIIEEDSE
jgi:hypothetical protein